ncbi:MAG TPA: ABC transporter substrate-binding protein [Solirubrobacterales bacterium]|nr:ABC transporter substrate-binding protein [Solirubrobacterales bacterium]
MRQIRGSRFLIIASLFVVAGLVLAACGGGSSSSSSSESGSAGEGGESSSSGSGSTVKVTSIADETGPTASTQVPYVAGLKGGFEVYNSELSGSQHKIEVEYNDDKYETAPGLAAYKKAESDGSLVSIGPNASDTQPAIVKAGMEIPLVSALTTTLLEEPMIWNTLPTFADQAKIMVNAAAKNQKGAKLKVAGLYYEVASGVEFNEALQAATEEIGGEFVGGVPIALEEVTGTWRTQAQKLAELEPTFIGVLSSAGDPQVFLPAIANAGLENVEVGGVTPLGLYKENWTKVPKALGEKFFVTSSISPADFGTEGAAEVEEAAKSQGEPEYANNLYFVQGFVIAKLVAEAINNAGEEPTPEDVNTALSEINGFEAGGLNPPLCFSKTDHYGTGLARPIKFNLKAQKFEPIGEFSEWEKYLSTPEGGSC